MKAKKQEKEKIAPKEKTKKKSPTPTVATIATWEQDPGSGSQPDGGVLIQQAVPQLSATSLPTVIQHPAVAPVAKVYSPGTAEFRYWAAAAALARGSAFWAPLLPGTIWKTGSKLPVDLDKGVDLNAYYDRVGLRFFHGVAHGRTVYSGESADVVCHEQGHAVLDAIKPQLWNAASLEAAAFHESFGDMTAILCALQLPSLRQGVLTETAGTVYRSSRLSRLAEQLGWAIRQSFPAGVETDCLRNAVNSFFYRDPNTLPSSAPATSLSSEPHSFSRVFTAAFFEALANMFGLQPTHDEASLLKVSTDMGKILAGGVKIAAVVPTFFSQVAIGMMHFANAQFSTIAYGQALKMAFVKHGIISPAATVSANLAEPVAGKKTRGAASISAVADTPEAAELPQLNLSIAEYGLGVDNITVHAAAEPKRFDVAGAALSFGSVNPPAQDEAAKAFFEDLLRRGKLKTTDAPATRGAAFFAAPEGDSEIPEHYTHELQKEGDSYVLRRLRIDCNFSCHCH